MKSFAFFIIDPNIISHCSKAFLEVLSQVGVSNAQRHYKFISPTGKLAKRGVSFLYGRYYKEDVIIHFFAKAGMQNLEEVLESFLGDVAPKMSFNVLGYIYLIDMAHPHYENALDENLRSVQGIMYKSYFGNGTHKNYKNLATAELQVFTRVMPDSPIMVVLINADQYPARTTQLIEKLSLIEHKLDFFKLDLSSRNSVIDLYLEILSQRPDSEGLEEVSTLFQGMR
jgi:hypothetical protein